MAALTVIVIVVLLLVAVGGFIGWRVSLPIRTGAGPRPRWQVLEFYVARYQRLPAHCQKGIQAMLFVVLPEVIIQPPLRAIFLRDISLWDVLGQSEDNAFFMTNLVWASPHIFPQCRVPALTQMRPNDFQTR